jgi:hypothetical protein
LLLQISSGLRDTRPVLGYAYHQTAALRICDAFSTFGIRAIAVVSFPHRLYPPLYHTIVGIFYSLFGKTTDAAGGQPASSGISSRRRYGVGRHTKAVARSVAAMLVGFFLT